MIAAGVDVVTVAKLAGHRNVQTTLSTYAHLIEGAKESAVAKGDQRLREDIATWPQP